MKGSERRQSQSRANQCRADLKSLRKSIEQVRQRAVDIDMQTAINARYLSIPVCTTAAAAAAAAAAASCTADSIAASATATPTPTSRTTVPLLLLLLVVLLCILLLLFMVDGSTATPPTTSRIHR